MQTDAIDVETDLLVSATSLESELHQRFQAYQFDPLVARLERKLGIQTQEARQLFADLKTWMYLCAVSDKPLSPPQHIDEAWHHFILFTRDYAKFCHDFCGRFVHHVSFDGVSEATESVAMRGLTHRNTVNMIVSLGLSGKNWLMGTSGSCCNGGNCSNTGGCSHCTEG